MRGKGYNEGNMCKLELRLRERGFISQMCQDITIYAKAQRQTLRSMKFYMIINEDYNERAHKKTRFR